jgi:Glycosyl transferase family 2
MLDLSATSPKPRSRIPFSTQISGKSDSVSGYQFRVEDLRVPDRVPGISAFMRIRNGADFLEATIRSHIGFFDEIVAVHNQCTDDTPEILARLQREFGSDRLRVIHYTDRVYPQGTMGHARARSTSPQSVVNYSNFALAATRHQYVTKLDDDHLAITEATQSICDTIRRGSFNDKLMYCFSGLNIVRRHDGRLGILAQDPISGNGDIGFFRVKPNTYFCHDRRFERFYRGGLRRVFSGYLYWHMKYVKGELGFGNYELQDNPSSRFAKRKSALVNNPIATHDLQQLAQSRHRSDH